MSEITERLKTAIADRYLIERELGQGGMATVYLAHDVKHDRKVALKVLRPELAAVIGAERFLQEIKVTANLQHSHILPLYDSGATEGFLYYVMPYVEGETLRTKLDREKQLAVEDAVALARAIAAALEHAHRQGIIHRDIKPENILLRDNDPLIADFGIALAVSHAGGNRLTETGLSIGTPQYMSPEQAMGDREMDARSDVYSLGAMMYEMLVGDPPYTGSTAQAIVAKVITEKATPVTTLRDTVPQHVSLAIHKALAKLPADRFPTAVSFAEALARPGLMDTTEYRHSTEPIEQPRRDWRLPAVAGVALVAVAVAIWSWLRPAPAAPAPPTTVFALDLGDAVIANTSGRLFDVSPDGGLFAFVGTSQAGGTGLFLRWSNSTSVTPIPGTEDATHPTFSPDGQWLAFAQGADLKKVRVAGGAPLTVARDANPFGIMWGDDDQIIMGAGRVRAVPGSGGTPREIPMVGDTVPLRWPALLPGGRFALVTEFPSLPESRIAVMNLETGEREVVIREGTHPHYVSTGHIVYGHPAGGIFGVPFDLGSRRVIGDPVPLVEDVVVFSGGATQFTVSSSGVAAYIGGAAASFRLVLVDRSGRATPLAMDTGAYSGPRFSPDGRRIAYEVSPAQISDIYVFDRALATQSRLTFTGVNRYPVWSPDGQWLAFSSQRDGSDGADGYRRRSDGGGAVEALFTMPNEQWVQAFTSDGGLLVRENTNEQGRDLLYRGASDTTFRPFLANPWNEFAARLSPDGQWVAYCSDETGSNEVYVTSFPEASGRWQVSQGGGIEPVWAPDGRGLYYWARDTLMVAHVAGGTAFNVTGRAVVLQGTFEHYTLFAQYDVQPDGNGFVMTQRISGLDQSVTIAVNWFTTLRERMGAGSQ